MMPNKMRGFTLIEMMIVVALIGIIVAFGYPSYRDQVIKSHRAEGMGELLELADRLERYYSDKNTYATATLGTAATDVYPAVTKKQNYALAIDGTKTDDIKFSITATPQGTQTADKCGTFILNSDGTKSITGSVDVDECWK